jgi:hypothetical protein
MTNLPQEDPTMRKLLAVLAVMLLAMPAFAAEFNPIAGVSTADSFFPVENLIQGPGVGFEADEPHNAIGPGGNTWVTSAPGGFPSNYIDVAGTPIIMVDLGQDTALNEISTWGYAADNANGVSEFSLRFATDAEGPEGAGTSISYNPTFTMELDPIPRQSNAFDELVTARYVEFTALKNFFVAPGDSTVFPPGGDRVGLGEIAFEVVPEPSGALLLLVGLIAFVRRRR